MIILITGASHSGKTLLSQLMIEKYRYSCLSLDHLKMGLIRSGYTDLTVEDDEKLTEYLWPIVREMIKTAVENMQNLIIEGCYVPFDWRADFQQNYLENIRFIALVMSETYIRQNYELIREYGNVVESRLEQDISLRSLLEDNSRYYRGFMQAGEDITLIESDFRKSIEKLVNE